MKLKTLTLVALTIHLAACGATSTTEDSAASADSLHARDGGGADAATDCTSLPDAGPAVDGSTDGGGACAGYAPFAPGPNGSVATIGDGAAGCDVATGVHPEGGYPTLEMTVGPNGNAKLANGTVTLSCKKGGVEIMAATIDCFEGSGEYQLRPGALVLGGHVSDRTCRLDLETAGDRVRGFMVCDAGAPSTTNVFANTQPPIGLGYFNLEALGLPWL